MTVSCTPNNDKVPDSHRNDTVSCTLISDIVNHSHRNETIVRTQNSNTVSHRNKTVFRTENSEHFQKRLLTCTLLKFLTQMLFNKCRM